jgi:hypothetical protein
MAYLESELEGDFFRPAHKTTTSLIERALKQVPILLKVLLST